MRTVFTDLLERGHDEDFEGVPCTAPTDALCGSRAKIEVMRQRAERGECLYHPQDNTEEIEPVEPRFYVPGIRELCVVVQRAVAAE